MVNIGSHFYEVEVEPGLMSHQTYYRSYRGRVFTVQMTKQAVSLKVVNEDRSYGFGFSHIRSTPPFSQ